MRSIKVNRRLPGGSVGLLGTASQSVQGWRFISNVASHKSGRVFRETWEKCLPRWCGYPDHCETQEVTKPSPSA